MQPRFIMKKKKKKMSCNLDEIKKKLRFENNHSGARNINSNIVRPRKSSSKIVQIVVGGGADSCQLTAQSPDVNNFPESMIIVK